MMKRSFAETDSARHEVDRQDALKGLEEDLSSLDQLDCPICSTDIDYYYSACARVTHLKMKMQVYVHLDIWVIIGGKRMCV